MSGKGKKKVVESRNDDDSLIMGSLDYSWSDVNEEVEGSTTPVHSTLPLAEATKRKRSELRPKAVRDPMAEVVPRVLPILAPRSMNRLKVAELRTILEEKRLSKDGVVDQYPNIWCTFWYHDFQQFTKPWLPNIPTWFREFYEGYAKFLPKGKKKDGKLTPIKFVEVWGKEVKYNEMDINDELNCTERTSHFLADKFNKSLDDLKGGLPHCWVMLLPRGL